MEQRYHEPFFGEGGLIPPFERLKKVLVVGAGVAGLQTARQFLKLGCQVLVLEVNDEVGGVWIRNYIGYGLQVPWKLYQFPEFPWPKDLQPSSEYPTGQEVQEYVRAYCREYNLRPHIRFNCKLLRLRWCPGTRQWDALYCDTSKEKFFKVTVDYTVICAGIYSQPYIPDYEGTDTYAGIQLHAKDFVDLSLARGRRVVIVGAGKTALDCVSSIVATNTATSVTLLYRQAHWPLPRRMMCTSVRSLLFNRAMAGMMPPYYTSGTGALAADRATAPLKKLFWRSMEAMISRKFRITEQMRPRVHLPTDLFYGGQILDNTMDKLIRSEALLTIKGEINRFVRNGVILQDGNFVAADLVLYCTGYLKTYEYLEGDMRARLDLQKDGLYLYRNCLPYAVPHLAFIGSEVSTYNNILTHGLQALWLAHVLAGRVPLPPVGAMVEDVRAQQRWRRGIMPAQRSRGSVLMVYMMQYHDQLLSDMGHKPKRKGFNFLAECFGAYTAVDYRPLLEQDHADTETARRQAEEHLAAAGVPSAVLAAAVSGRSGPMAPMPPASSLAHPSPPPPAGSVGGGTATHGRASANSMGSGGAATHGRGTANGMASAGGAGGVGGPALPATAAAMASGMAAQQSSGQEARPVVDERLYATGRAGTSPGDRSLRSDRNGADRHPGGNGYGSPDLATAAMTSPGAALSSRVSDADVDPRASPDPPPLLASPPPRFPRRHSITATGFGEMGLGRGSPADSDGGAGGGGGRRPSGVVHSEHLGRTRRSCDYTSTALQAPADIAGAAGAGSSGRRCHPLSFDVSHSPAPSTVAYAGAGPHCSPSPTREAGGYESQQKPAPRHAASARAATVHGYSGGTSSGLSGFRHPSSPSQTASSGGAPSAGSPTAGHRSFTARAAPVGAGGGSGGLREGGCGPGLLLVPSSPSRLCRHTGPSSPPPQALPPPSNRQAAFLQTQGTQANSRQGQQAAHAYQAQHWSHASMELGSSAGRLLRVGQSSCRSAPDNALEGDRYTDSASKNGYLASSPENVPVEPDVTPAASSPGGGLGNSYLITAKPSSGNRGSVSGSLGTGSVDEPQALAAVAAAVEATMLPVGPASEPGGGHTSDLQAQHLRLVDTGAGGGASEPDRAPAGPYGDGDAAPGSGVWAVGQPSRSRRAVGSASPRRADGETVAGDGGNLLAENGGICSGNREAISGGRSAARRPYPADELAGTSANMDILANAHANTHAANSSSRITACGMLVASSAGSDDRSHRLSSRSRSSGDGNSGASSPGSGSPPGDRAAASASPDTATRVASVTASPLREGTGPGVVSGVPPPYDGPATSAESFWRVAARDGRHPHPSLAALTAGCSDNTSGSLGSAASLSYWQPVHHGQRPQDDGQQPLPRPSGDGPSAAATALPTVPATAHRGGPSGRRSSYEALRPPLGSLAEEGDDTGGDYGGDMAGLGQAAEATLAADETGDGARGTGHLLGPLPQRFAAANTAYVRRGGSLGSAGGAIRGREAVGATDAVAANGWGTPGGTVPYSGAPPDWPLLLPGVSSNGGCGIMSPGSSGLLLNSNITLAAGMGAASSMLMHMGCTGSTGGGGSGSPARPLPAPPLSRPPSHAFNDSCSLGHWVGQVAAAALANGGSSADAAGGSVGASGSEGAATAGTPVVRRGPATSSAPVSSHGTVAIGAVRGGGGDGAANVSAATASLLAMAGASPFKSPRGYLS